MFKVICIRACPCHEQQPGTVPVEVGQTYHVIDSVIVTPIHALLLMLKHNKPALPGMYYKLIEMPADNAYHAELFASVQDDEVEAEVETELNEPACV